MAADRLAGQRATWRTAPPSANDLVFDGYLPAASPIGVLRSEYRAVHGEALPGTVWPEYGQAAFLVTGQSQIHAGPHQHPAAIASVAKVMTAYLVLRDHPLRPGQAGTAITLTDADVADTDRRVRDRRGSRAMGRRLGGAVSCPDECGRTVAGHDPDLAAAAAMVDRIAGHSPRQVRFRTPTGRAEAPPRTGQRPAESGSVPVP
jgi:hypothetical protein